MTQAYEQDLCAASVSSISYSRAIEYENFGAPQTRRPFAVDSSGNLRWLGRNSFPPSRPARICSEVNLSCGPLADRDRDRNRIKDAKNTQIFMAERNGNRRAGCADEGRLVYFIFLKKSKSLFRPMPDK
ncbi:hypothetical protein [Burkholderia oklahomensis]|uniref:hypothetical protein n=1 Tax=Burkholderia oklahomensis TaxID=342113 RepID=UPI000F5239A9|nr:hypothetical protein [Burkholderia oklahomensis]MBI0362527.1 hypothetical protein [Burkholderia oklahomensis]